MITVMLCGPSATILFIVAGMGPARGPPCRMLGPSREETLGQLNLAGVVEVMSGNPVDVLTIGPLGFRRLGVEASGREPGDRLPQEAVLLN